jgi:hypothetical protein
MILLFLSSPDGREGTCLGQLTLPALWWPSMTHSGAVGTDLTKAKQPKVNIKVSYSAYETKGQNCLGEQGTVDFEVYIKGSSINITPNLGLMGEGVKDIVTNFNLGFSLKSVTMRGGVSKI